MTDNDSMKGGEIDIMSLILVVLQVISYDFNFPLIFETLEKYSLEKIQCSLFFEVKYSWKTIFLFQNT